MRTVKKVLAILMALALLAAVPVTAVSAEIDSSVVIFDEVLHSITVEETTGHGLAFLYTMNIQGAATNDHSEFVNDNATATVDGTTYQVVKMGAVLTNQTDNLANVDDLTLADVNANRIIDIPAKYLYDYTATECSFAVRIINLPVDCRGNAIACRPYIVLKDEGGNETTVYGGGDISTYYKVYYNSTPEYIPTLDLALANVDDRIHADASAEYVAYAPTTYKESFQVALTLENVSANAQTSTGDWVEYTCYDQDGNALSTEKVTVDVLAVGATKSVVFYAPIGTAAIDLTDSNLNYVPDITLPAIGSDIDVTNQKNRIRVSKASASFAENGTIDVSLTFRNYTSNWITEETDWVAYTCYDADGNVVQAATRIYIGCIDTKKNVAKTFAFDVPANTAEVRLTNSKIVYWTEWA